MQQEDVNKMIIKCAITTKEALEVFNFDLLTIIIESTFKAIGVTRNLTFLRPGEDSA